MVDWILAPPDKPEPPNELESHLMEQSGFGLKSIRRMLYQRYVWRGRVIPKTIDEYYHQKPIKTKEEKNKVKKKSGININTEIVKTLVSESDYDFVEMSKEYFNNDKLYSLIIVHNDIANKLSIGLDLTIYERQKYKKLGRLIALYLSGFKCESCSYKEELTIHHMVTRENKHFFSRVKYFTIRNNYKQLVVLCPKCHNTLHKNFGELKPVSDKEINMAKRKLNYKKSENPNTNP